MKNKSTSKIALLYVILIVLTYKPKQGIGKEFLHEFSQSRLKKFQTEMQGELLNLQEVPIKTVGFKATNIQARFSNGENQHLLGRYIITSMGSVGLWTITVAVSSLIDNGNPSPSKEWFEDSFWLIARPSLILGSTTISMLLFKHKNFRTFISLLALNSAVLTTAYFSGKLVSDEADLLLQLTTTFFVVPLISTLYNNAFPEQKSIKVGQLQINLPEPSIQVMDKELWIGGRIGFQW